MDLDSLLVRGAQGVVLVRGSYLIQRGEVQCIVQLPPNKRESVSRAAAASQFLNSSNSCLQGAPYKVALWLHLRLLYALVCGSYLVQCDNLSCHLLCLKEGPFLCCHRLLDTCPDINCQIFLGAMETS